MLGGLNNKLIVIPYTKQVICCSDHEFTKQTFVFSFLLFVGQMVNQVFFTALPLCLILALLSINNLYV